jgi:hypothetical protein
MEQSRVTGALGGAGQGAAAGAAFGPYGAAIGAGLGAIGGLLGGGGEDKAKELAEEQAALMMRYEAENQRRLGLELRKLIGGNKAASYASNLIQSGSTKTFQDVQQSTFRNDMAWQAYTAKKSAEAVVEGGREAASSIKRAGIGSMISGFTAAAGAFGPSFKSGLGTPASPVSSASSTYSPGTMIKSGSLDTSSITSGFKI